MTTIKVRFQLAGFHRWEGAPQHRAYLKPLHRHNFHVEVEMQVLHHGREVEMHDLQDQSVRLFLYHGMERSSNRSCEDMAEELISELRDTYGFNRFYAVEVWEDGECGARVTYEPPATPPAQGGHDRVEEVDGSSDVGVHPDNLGESTKELRTGTRGAGPVPVVAPKDQDDLA